MDIDFWLLQAAVFAAAALQAAAGMGFGLLAAPALLLVLGTGSAVQVVIALSMGTAFVLVIPVRRDIELAVVGRLLIGVLLGLPLGVMFSGWIDIRTLKLGAGLVVSTMAVFAMRGASVARGRPRAPAVAVGAVAGVMTALLAMPGPAPATWLVRRGLPRRNVRATLLALFVPAYGSALAVAALFGSLDPALLHRVWTLLPAVSIGLAVGVFVAPRFGESFYRKTILAILLVSGVALLVDSVA